MKISRLATGAVSAVAAAAFLAACSGGGAGGSQSSSVTPTTVGSSQAKAGGAGIGIGSALMHRDHSAKYLSIKAPKFHRNHHKSWMKPDAKNAPRLLFISDTNQGEVDVFTMPGMVLKGQLTGFYQVQGECSDYKTGNVWIVDTAAKNAYQYTRTGTLVSVLAAKNGYPAGCAVNPVNGDVALTDIYGTYFAPGGVEIFPGGSGSPTFVQNPNQYEFFFDGYDSSGNLFVDGLSYPYFQFTLSEVPYGSNLDEHRRDHRRLRLLPGYGPVGRLG